MLTIVMHMTVKAGREDESAAVCEEVTKSTRSQDEGCLSYTFYRRRDDPRELMLFEQWRDAVSIKAHLERLYQVCGPPDDTEPYPPHHHRWRISKAFVISSARRRRCATTRSAETRFWERTVAKKVPRVTQGRRPGSHHDRQRARR